MTVRSTHRCWARASWLETAGRSDLTNYVSWGAAIAVTIGPTGGAGQFPGQDKIVGREAIAQMKGREMGIDPLRERLGLAAREAA